VSFGVGENSSSLHDPEDEGTTILWNDGCCTASSTVSHPRRTDSLA